MSILQTISDLLESYEAEGATMSVPALLNLQDSLSVNSYRLAAMAAEAKSKYNGDVFTKKITINRQTQALINAQMSKAAATVQAESSKIGEEMIQAELESEAIAYKLDLLLGQVNKVLSAIQQRISYAKQEQHGSKYYENLEINPKG